MTRDDIAVVLEKLPLLNDFGIGLSLGGSGLTREQRQAQLAEGREALLNKEVECTRACEWLIGLKKTKTINGRHTSYGYKHMAKNATGHYMTNGAFIAAAIHCGFNYSLIPGSPNVWFNISEKSVKGMVDV